MFEYLKTLKIKSSNPVELLVLGDLHYGADCQDRKLIKAAINYVKSKDNCYLAHIGDGLDSPIAGSKGYREGAKSLNASLEEYKADFEPVVKMGKFIGGVQGNHDMRVSIHAKVNIDLIEMCHNEWSLRYNQPIMYGTPGLLVAFAMKDKTGREGKVISILLAHGSGGGCTPGTAANSILKHRNLCANADVYVQGHFHKQSYLEELATLYNGNTGSLTVKKQIFSTIGASTGYEHYAANLRLAQSTPSCGLIQMSTKRTKTSSESTVRFQHVDKTWFLENV